MTGYNIITQSSDSTVVTEYKSNIKRSDAYQSEADLERVCCKNKVMNICLFIPKKI